MRFLHTADWHLGRIFHNVHLTEDQGYVLEQLIDIAKTEAVDLVIIAGDIYDRAVPPNEAVKLLDYVLSEIVGGLEIPIILISGNHDSSERLEFGASLLRKNRLYIVGSFPGEIRPIILSDKYGPIYIYPIPYAEPLLIRDKLADASIEDHYTAFKVIINHIKSIHPIGKRSIIVSHAFVAGGKESESERPLSIGGVGSISPDIFGDISYVALGHLHRAQYVKEEHLQYPGSILKYSFSEISQQKAINLVEMDHTGKCKIEHIFLRPKYDLRSITGKIDEIISKGREDHRRQDYLLVTLLDEGPVFNAMSRLREVYPNVLHIERPYFSLKKGVSVDTTMQKRRLTEKEIFFSFFYQVTGKQMSQEESDVFSTIIEDLHKEDQL